MWQRWIEKSVLWARKIPKISIPLLGLGFARAWLWWILEKIAYSPALPILNGLDAYFLFDMGEVAGFMLLAFLSLKIGPFFRKGWALSIAVILTIAVSCVLYLSPEIELPFIVEALVCVLGGFGYAFLLMLWLELYGCLSPKNMILAWSYSFFLGLIFRNALSPLVLVVLIPLFPLISAIMYTRALARIDPEKLPDNGISHPPFPAKFVICLGAIALSFGVGGVMSGQNMFGFAAQIGMAIPEVILLFGIIVFRERFDLKILLSVAPVLITAGIAVAFFTDFRVVPSNILMYASSQTYLILAYAIGCTISHRLKCSSVFLCGIMSAVHKMFLQVGSFLTLFFTTHETMSSANVTMLGIAMILIALTASVTMMGDRDLVERFSFGRSNNDGGNDDELTILAKRHGLTSREVAVLALLLKGLTAPEIAEELFLASSTVRVHTSNIYRKFEVHSRKELRGKLRGFVE